MAGNAIKRLNINIITLGYLIQKLILTGNPLTTRMQAKLAAIRDEDGARAAQHILVS